MNKQFGHLRLLLTFCWKRPFVRVDRVPIQLSKMRWIRVKSGRHKGVCCCAAINSVVSIQNIDWDCQVYEKDLINILCVDYRQ